MIFGAKKKTQDPRRAARAYSNRIARAVGRRWRMIFMSLLSIMIIALALVAVYLWQTYVRMQDVAQEELRQYITTKQEETSFKREAFDNLKDSVELRRLQFDNPPQFYDSMFHY